MVICQLAEILTAKQEKYVMGVVSGLSQREAYRQAYPSSLKWKEASIDQKASTLLRNVKVKARYLELMNEHKKESLWSRDRAVNELLFLVDHAKSEINDVGLNAANKGAFVDALKELNKLEQVYDETNVSKEYTKAQTELTKAKTGLIKGTKADTSMMQALLTVLGDTNE